MARIITQTPLTEIWNDQGPLIATWLRYLTGDEIRQFLKAGPIQFVEAGVSCPLNWVVPDQCFAFWQDEVRPHLVNDPEGDFSIDDFPDSYAYVASEWKVDEESLPVVVLECHH